VDVYTKKVVVRVEWQELSGLDNKIEGITYLTNWDSFFWNQSDWSGGAGQVIWADESRYDNSANINSSSSGQIALSSTGGGCSGYLWSFDNPGDYLYDSQKIEVSQGMASLILREEGCGGTAFECSSFSFESDCLAQSNCTWDLAQCSGQPASCQNLSEGACSSCGCQVAPGWCSGSCSCWQRGISQADCQCGGISCGWRNVFGGFCYGGCSCNTADTQTCCESHGCLWTPGNCSGQPNPCSSYNSQAECANCGCLWRSAFCSGRALECSSFSDSLSCQQQEGCSWHLAGYPFDKPSIRPQLSYVSAAVDLWTGFSESSVKNGGEIYYQLSDDDGLSWYWWDGADWSLAQAGDFNTAVEVNQNIEFFNAYGKRRVSASFP
jgi:hypothetical protein